MTRLVLLLAAAGVLAACKPETSRQASRAANDVVEQREDLKREAAEVEERMSSNKPNLVKEATDVVKEAGELAQAQTEFEQRKTVRIQAVKAQHEVIATQPMLISTMAKNFRITDAARGEINEKLSQFQMRLDEAANLIQGLQNADADVWDARDANVNDAMKRLDDAREDAWEALDDAPSVDPNAS